MDRVLAHAEVDEESKTRLRALYARADPVLLAEVRAAQAVLGERVDRRGTQATPAQPIIVDPDRFTASLKTAWREGNAPASLSPPQTGTEAGRRCWMPTTRSAPGSTASLH
jgi:hypothetical protein